MYEIKIKLIENYKNKNNDDIIKNIFNNKIIFEQGGINSLPVNIIHSICTNSFCQYVASLDPGSILLININNYKLPVEPQFLYSGYEKQINPQTKFKKYTLIREIIYYTSLSLFFPYEILNLLNNDNKYHMTNSGYSIKDEHYFCETHENLFNIECNSNITSIFCTYDKPEKIVKQRDLFLDIIPNNKLFYNFSCVLKNILVNDCNKFNVLNYLPSSTTNVILKKGFCDDIFNLSNNFYNKIKKIPLNLKVLLYPANNIKLEQQIKNTMCIGHFYKNSCRFDYDDDDYWWDW